MPMVHSGKTVKSVFSIRNIEIFNNHLNNEIWEDVYLHTDVNRVYSSFLSKYCKYFVNIFPLKKFSKNKGIKSGWLTKGIKVSGQRLRLLHLLKKKMSMSSQTLDYINKYQITYKKVISEARKRDEIPEKLVKEGIQFIKKPLTFIFNISLCTGTFQHLMEIANVRPLHK
jgi:hypothetical protein